MADSNPSPASSKMQESTDWCMSGFLGLRIVVVIKPGTVDNLVINLNVEKWINTTPDGTSLALSPSWLGLPNDKLGAGIGSLVDPFVVSV